MSDMKIMPVEELLHEDEFTGRVEILRKLENWVENIGTVGGSSTSIIAPRRMGKTVLLDRFVNIIFFKPEYKVAPFYIKFKREETTLKHFLKEYALTFFRQYIGYCIQDPTLYRSTIVDFEDLLDIKSEHNGVKYAKKYLKGFLKRFNKNDLDDIRNHWDSFIKVPEENSSFSKTRLLTIIDEFQDMKFYVYDTDESGLKEWKSKNQGKPSYAAIDLTATYDRQSESRKAPMLVSGSSVTLIFRTVMGGPLGGRFSFKYLKPLSIDERAPLLTKLIKIYLKDVSITAENAIYASVKVTGHTYYLFCLVDSDYPDKKSRY